MKTSILHKAILVAVATILAGSVLLAAPTAHGASSQTLRASGSWSWWGYRTNRAETWALRTQSATPSLRYVPIFGQYVALQARVWMLTAINARLMNKCVGLTWTGSSLIVDCAP